MLTISADSTGAGGGSEVWIARSGDATFFCEFSTVPANSDICGECEYRLAANYGYAYNFLISYGDNLGTVLQIPYSADRDSELLFYCSTSGGVITLTD